MLEFARMASDNTRQKTYGVSEIYLVGVLIIRESYHLGSILGVPSFRKPPYVFASWPDSSHRHGCACSWDLECAAEVAMRAPRCSPF